MTHLNKAGAKLMFFASCPKCKKKFGIEPRFIGLFVERLIKHFGMGNFKGVRDLLAQAQDNISHSKEKEG